MAIMLMKTPKGIAIELFEIVTIMVGRMSSLFMIV
jgi:hypothetical protein